MRLDQSALATGFAVPQQGTTGLGRANAGNAAAAQDPSTAFFNPAGMTELSRPEISFGSNLIIPRIDFENRGTSAATPATLGASVPIGNTDADNPGRPTPVPHLYGVYPAIDDILWLGIAVTAPFGLNAKYDREWFGRYDSIESKLQTIDFSPAVAIKINDYLSVGGGVNLQYASATLSNAVPNTLQPGGPSVDSDGMFEVDGSDDLSVGFNIGVLLKPWPSTRVGLHYRSGIDHTVSGRAKTSGLTGPLAAANGKIDAKADVNLPAITAFAVVQELTEQLRLYGEFTWYDWSSFDEIRVKFSDGMTPDAVRKTDYRDTYAVSFGAEFDLTDALTLRSGFQFDRTPTRDRTRDTSLPDGNRYWFSIGASYQIEERLFIDFGFTHVIFEDGAVNLDREFFAGTPAAGTVHIAGEAESVVNTIALNLRYRF